jgi:hypothetical protein
MDLIDESHPTSFLLNELAAWESVATLKMNDNTERLLGFEAGVYEPATEAEREARIAWKAMVKIQGILWLREQQQNEKE